MDKIVIKDLEVDAHVGVTKEERAKPQRLLITVELHRALATAGKRDAEADTARYDVVAQLVREIATDRPRRLAEAVAEEIAAAILARRFAPSVTVEVKKFSVPKTRYVLVQVTRP
jgi:dihydroneopterin aldolase